MGVRVATNAPTQPSAVPATAPTGGSYVIERARLDHRYVGARGRLVRMLAPAGYGKTTQAARWVRSDERHVCWLEVDRGDDDAVTLFSKLRAALAPAVAIPDPTPIPAPSANPYVDAIRAGFNTGDEPEPFVLVLDDVHRLHSASTGWLVEELVERLPSTSTIVLVGRGHHDHGAIGRFRLAPGVVDVTTDDLVFDRSEVHQFLSSVGIDPADPAIAATLDLLVGWPAGLRLAANAIQHGADPPRVVDQMALIDYLRAEWLASLDPADLGFLREIACLERSSGATCDEVLGRTGSAEVLERLHRRSSVVFGLDQRGEWYRLHPLLGRWLSADLRSSDPDRWVDVHVNAARFWERTGDIDRAVEHALAAGDFALLEAIVVTHAGGYFTRDARATVSKWLDAFPPEQARASPGLCGIHCINALHQGDETRGLQWRHLLDEAVEAAGRPETEPTTWWPMVLTAALEPRPARDLLPIVAAARTHLSHGPWTGFACWTHGALSFLCGDIDTAREALTTGRFEAELTDNPLVRAHCLATASVIDHCVGDTDEALAKTRQSIDVLRDRGGAAVAPMAIDLAVATLLHAMEGRPDDAARQLATARHALVGFPDSTPWFNIIARIPLVRTALLLDDRELSRSLMIELEHHARFDLPGVGETPGQAMACVAELRRQVDAMHQPAGGASALTDAELRVLRLMPTNLSLADIATRLFVSRNTVKSHAASIYRKLGADNRGQAVGLAAAAGLIEPTA